MNGAGVMSWNEAMRVEALATKANGERTFGGHVNDDWTSLQGVHGGVVAALAVTAAERVLRDEGVDPATTLRAATFGYASGNVAGDLTIEVEVVRRGRTMVTTHTRTVQNGKTTTVGRLHHSMPWDGAEYSDAPPPPVRPPDAVRLGFADRKAHLHNTETYHHPATSLFGGGERSEWMAWGRPLGGGSFDSAWLTMYGDYFPPAVLTRGTGPMRAVTIEYALQVHSAAGSWTLGADEHLAVRMHAFHSHDGFAVEDGWIHLPDGSLLATVRQTRLAG